MIQNTPIPAKVLTLSQGTRTPRLSIHPRQFVGTDTSEASAQTYANLAGNSTKPQALTWDRKTRVFTATDAVFENGLKIYGAKKVQLIRCTFKVPATSSADYEHGLQCVGCDDIEIIQCLGVGRGGDVNTGETNYIAAFDYCSKIKFRDYIAMNGHRAAVFSTSTGIDVDRATIWNCAGSFDFHGLAGGNGVFRNIRSAADFFAGNNAWPHGCDNVIVEDSTFPRFKAIGRATNLIIRRCRLTAYSEIKQLFGGVGANGTQYNPGNILFQNCAMVGCQFTAADSTQATVTNNLQASYGYTFDTCVNLSGGAVDFGSQGALVTQA